MSRGIGDMCFPELCRRLAEYVFLTCVRIVFVWPSLLFGIG